MINIPTPTHFGMLDRQNFCHNLTSLVQIFDWKKSLKQADFDEKISREFWNLFGPDFQSVEITTHIENKKTSVVQILRSRLH